MVAYNVVNGGYVDGALGHAADRGLGVIAMKAAHAVATHHRPLQPVPLWRVAKVERVVPGELKAPLKAYLWALHDLRIAAVISNLWDETHVEENLSLAGKSSSGRRSRRGDDRPAPAAREGRPWPDDVSCVRFRSAPEDLVPRDRTPHGCRRCRPVGANTPVASSPGWRFPDTACQPSSRIALPRPYLSRWAKMLPSTLKRIPLLVGTPRPGRRPGILSWKLSAKSAKSA